MKKTIFIICICYILGSCGTRKRTVTRKKIEPEKEVVKKEKEKKETVPETEITPKKTPIVNNTRDYIKVYKDIAISEMREYKIPASITLAQGILESGSGKGRLATQANNHFGIKCHDWRGAKIYHDDDKRQECFRKYNNAKYSFRDHSEFLAKRKRYANLFKLDINDYKGWARELRKAGYATDKRYPEKLIILIDRYNLTQYDTSIPGEKSKKRKRIPVKKEIVQHRVIKGDTLYSLSKRYRISVEKLKQLNNIKGTDIKIGQVLNIED